jgi:hypothetical protein
MSVSIESGVLHPKSYASTASCQSEALERWLPASLSVVAGMVDVIGLLSLGLFTAHVIEQLLISPEFIGVER